METYFRSKPIRPKTWLIEAEGCTAYLLVGEDYGLVIDTGYSGKNVRAYAQSLMDKPVNIVANTHGHFDQTADNGWFEYAYVSAEAAKTAKNSIPQPPGQVIQNKLPDCHYHRRFQVRVGQQRGGSP